MPDTYTVLLRLGSRHQYFTDEVLRTLAVVPTPASAERLRRAGWLLKPQADGFVLLVPASWSAEAPAPFPLLFQLQPREASFHLYTDLPLTPDAGLAGTQLAGGRLAYCFSLPPAAALPLPTEVVASPDNQLALRPLKFDYLLPDKEAAELWQVPAAPQDQALGRYEAGARRVQVDVSAYGSGHYELRSRSATFPFYADDYLAAARAWGLLVLTEQVLAAPLGAHYTLRFAARLAYWQYQVRQPLPPAPAVFTIAGDTTGLDFEAVPPAAGSSACFRARKAVPLAQHYTLPPLHLAIHHPAADDKRKLRIIPGQLPYGQVDRVKEININTKIYYIAEIFI